MSVEGRPSVSAAGDTPAEDTEARLQRLEAHQAIQQLAVRYAIAVDSRDLDALSALWAPTAWMGRAHGQGPAGARSFYSSVLHQFYRSVHIVAGHHIEIQDSDNAHGTVYCRAEHELADTWIVEMMAYADTYQRVDGHWGFVKRIPRFWYTSPLDEAPRGPQFDAWPGGSGSRPSPDLPHAWTSWQQFWGDVSAESVDKVTRHPVPTTESERS